MRGPPLPFYRGRSLVATVSGEWLVIRPVGGAFREPAGTTALHLPVATIVTAEARDDSVVFVGDFRRVDRPSRVRLAPIEPSDAVGITGALAARLGLPRRARAVDARELARLSAVELVEVIGARMSGHHEGPDFEKTRLVGDAPTGDGVFRVTGFLHPGSAPTDLTRGYTGPELMVLDAQRLLGGALGREHSFAIEAAPSGLGWHVLVDGKRVPMTREERETTTTNAGSYDTVLRVRARVDSVEDVDLHMARDAFEIRTANGGWTATCRVSSERTAMYNTVIGLSTWLTLTFPGDLSSAAITISRMTDTSS